MTHISLDLWIFDVESTRLFYNETTIQNDDQDFNFQITISTEKSIDVYNFYTGRFSKSISESTRKRRMKLWIKFLRDYSAQRL